MATKKPASKTTRKSHWEQQTQLWAQPTASWVELLQSPEVAAGKTVVSGTTVKICCPYHTDKNPSGHINTTKGYYKCFSESCRKGVKDPVLLVQRLMGNSYTEAFGALRKYFKLTQAIRLDVVEEHEAATTQRRRMSLISTAVHDYLCNVWQDAKLPPSTTRARDWLRDSRGIVDVMATSSLGLLPRKDAFVSLLQSAGARKEDVRWALRLFADYLGTGYTDCVVYTYALAPDYVTAFKLRLPSPDKASVRVVRADPDGPMGCFGLIHSAYVPLIWSDKVDSVILVEGEHDQLAAYQGQSIAGIYDEIFVALGGSGHQGVDFLANVGITKASIVGDHDEAGSEYPKSILAKTHKVACSAFSWPIKLQNPSKGKLDPDEAIKLHGFKDFRAAVIKAKNFQFAPDWCYARVKTDLVNVPEGDVARHADTIAGIAGILHNRAELRAFSELIAADYAWLTPIDVRQAGASGDVNPIAFVSNLVEWLRSEFMALGYDSESGLLILWHIKRKREVRVRVATAAGFRAILQFVPGGTPHALLTEAVGFPDFILSPTDGDADWRASSALTNTVREALDNACSVLTSQLSSNSAPPKGQGIHLAGVHSGGPGYVVNGTAVYKLEWRATGRGFKAVSLLEGPIDGDNIFDLRHNPTICGSGTDSGWLLDLKSTEDFTQDAPLSLLQCYNYVADIIGVACEFKHQSVDVMYAALLVMYSYVSDSMQKKVMTHVMGQHESGKSTLLSILCGQAQMPEYSLTPHAVTTDNTTTAAIFQTFAASRLLLGLDELNDPNDESRESLRVQHVYRALRGLATKGSADVLRGTPSGLSRAAVLSNPVVTASGTHIHHPMDKSRFNVLELVKNPHKGNTRQALRRKFSPALIKEIRLSLFLGMLQEAPAIARAYLVLTDTFGAGEVASLQRKQENLIPLVAIANVIGLDGAGLVQDYTNSRKEEQAVTVIATPGEQLVNAFIAARIFERSVDSVPRRLCLKDMLLNKLSRDDISYSGMGVYYDDDSRCVGVDWQAMPGFLRNQVRGLRYASVEDQCAVMRSAPQYISASQAKARGVTRRLASLGLISPTIVYLEVGYILDASEEAQKEQSAYAKREGTEVKSIDVSSTGA